MKKLVVVGCFIFCLLHCYAQTANYRFDNLTEKQGLADANIASIVKDHTGYMWFASSEGLNRFDGKNCRVYHHLNADSNSLSNDNINAIFEDSKQRLWIATRNGLNLYDPVNDGFKRFYNDPSDKNSISSNEVWSLAEDNNGNLWIGTMGGGLNKPVEIKQNENTTLVYNFIHLRHDSSLSTSLSDDMVWSIAFNRSGQGWVGTNNGLNRFSIKDASDDTISFTHYFSSGNKNSISSNVIWRVYIDDNNYTWLLSFSGMLDCIIPGENDSSVDVVHVLPALREQLPAEEINALTLVNDHANSFWIGTDKNGLLHCTIDVPANAVTVNVGLVEHFKNINNDDQSLVNDAVYDLYQDESGLIWIGTANGISRYTPQKNLFGKLHLAYSTPGDFPVKLVYGDDEYTWFAYNNQLWVLHGLQTKLQLACSLDESEEITSLHRTSMGELLIGTVNKLYLISPGDIRSIIPGKNKITTHVPVDIGSVFSFITVDSNNIIAGRYSAIGLLNINTYGFTKFSVQQQAGITPIFRCLAKYKDFYFAGTDNGLYSINKKNYAVQLWQPRSGRLSSDRINSLLVLKNELWIATMNGLNVVDLNTNSVRNYFVQDGLADNNIIALSNDDEGNIWIATRNGLSCYNSTTKIFSVYTISEGLNSSQLNALAFKKDILFIAGDKGINTVSPSALKKISTKINIVISDFKIAGKSQFAYPVTLAGKAIKQQQTVNVSWRENNISIEFTALEYKNPGGIKYGYMLEGFDKDWVYNGNQSQVSYTNLSGGNYTFKIKYAANDGVWHHSSIALPVHVTTAWFKAWWFYLACCLTIAALFYSFYRIRLNRIIELQKVRNKIARDLHDDIGSTLSTIKILSDAARKKIYTESTNAEQMLEKIGDSSRKMMDSMSDIVWSINPDNDSVNNLVVRMREYAAQALEPKNISYNIMADDKAMSIKLSLEKRRDFFLIFKEAVNNLAKYSCALEAAISVTLKKNNLQLSIKDNGNGFDTGATHSGNGLKNMQYRARNLHGNLEIISAENNGTVVLLTIPFT